MPDNDNDDHALVIYSPVERVTFDQQGMTVIGLDLTYNEWEIVCTSLTDIHRKYFMFFLWAWGDALTYGEIRHGQKYSQAVNDTGLAPQTLSNYVWLAKATPKALRGLPHLGQSHYEQVVKVKDYEMKRDLLQIASKEKWPAKTTLAKAVTALLGPGESEDNNQQNTTPPGSQQDELDLAAQRRYMLEKQNTQLQLEQEMLQSQIGQAKELLRPILDQVQPNTRLDIEKAMDVLRAESNGEALTLVKEIVHLYRQGDMTALVDTLDKLSKLME